MARIFREQGGEALGEDRRVAPGRIAAQNASFSPTQALRGAPGA